jgi:hypothetical protein
MDTTVRKICFNLGKQSKHINFSKYEYLLYILAQINRLTHDDTGFAWKVMTTCLGLSNDIVNHLLYRYDTEEKEQRITPAPIGDGHGRPMMSYTTEHYPTRKNKCWGVYISTNKDLTANILQIENLPIKRNSNSIFVKSDIIISFKSTSTIVNLLTDIHSQFVKENIQTAVETTGIKIAPECYTAKSFIELLMTGWNAIIRALQEFSDKSRIFVTGHSLGGALATIFGFIMAEGKASNTLPINIKSIHIISFGSPKVFNIVAKERFNSHLIDGIITYDQVVNQTRPHTTFDLSSIYERSDWAPRFPIGYEHPGIDGEEPYSLDEIRKYYGVDSETRFRDEKTWPFSEPIDLYTDKEKLTSLTNRYMVGGVKYLPNLVSIQARPDIFFVHSEMLGMINKPAHRTYGMKNPVGPYSDLIAYFMLCSSGVKIQYLNPDNKLVHYSNKLKKPTKTRKHKKIM